ncbi:MAG: family 16 glycosylhydrolase [Granulosicoccus sp.]|nr:family 16 glycosylhydrolase [Granulosicoccus sp.]
MSAAQLSNDTVNTVSFAQAVAAGAVESPAGNAGDTPAVGAATPGQDNGQQAVNPLATVSPVAEATDTTSSAIVTVSSTGSVELESIPVGTASPVNPDNSGNQVAGNNGTSGSNQSTGAEPSTGSTGEQAAQASASQGNSTTSGSSSAQFESHTSPGFKGEVLDDSIRISWQADPDARGYNVYKQAKYITTVFATEYIDTDVYDRDYYYEIQAFDYSDKLYYIATGLTVSARTLGRTDPDAPAPNSDLLKDYELIFADEFNGNALDTSKWNTAYLWGPDLVINSEEQYYVDIINEPDFGFNPFTFDGNHLTINSIKTPPALAAKARNQPYLSGVITSYDALKFTYGYVETRAKVTYGRGYWPAFWLLNAFYVDDKPEIDIMEFIGDDQDVVYHTYHYYDAEGNLRSTKSQPTPGIDYTADFHTYAAEWKPGTIIYFVDGIEVHRVTDPKVSRQDMYVIANTALGGWWAGSPDALTPFPGKYTIDYIRVYQRTTPFDDVLLNDGITNVPYADDIPGQAAPNHRPTPEQWPEGYPDGR